MASLDELKSRLESLTKGNLSLEDRKQIKEILVEIECRIAAMRELEIEEHLYPLQYHVSRAVIAVIEIRNIIPTELDITRIRNYYTLELVPIMADAIALVEQNMHYLDWVMSSRPAFGNSLSSLRTVNNSLNLLGEASNDDNNIVEYEAYDGLAFVLPLENGEDFIASLEL